MMVGVPQREMGQPGTHRFATELSGNSTTPRHATTPEVKTTTGGLPRGSLWDS
jgi:hypothetical protein